MERGKIVMKRKRRSNSKRAEREEEQGWEMANRMFPTLPSHIVMNILSKLPLQQQLICKHNLNFNSIKPYFLFKSTLKRGFSRILSLLDLNDPDFGTKKIEFKPKINVPNRKFEFASSCNGLLCLSLANGRELTYICNPISGEYFVLSFWWACDSSYVGFGFSPKTKQYKVLRLGVRTRQPLSYELHVFYIGEECGRTLANVPFIPRIRSFNAFLRGALHWVDCDRNSSVFIRSFDFDDDRCKVIPPPVHFGAAQKERSEFMSVGGLRDCLYITDVAFEDCLDIWVMKDYRVEESWIKVFTVRNLLIRKESRGRYEPIMITKSGEILMIVDDCALVSYDTVLEKFTNLGISGMKTKFEALAYFPSLTSLRDFPTTVYSVINNRSLSQG